MIEAVPIPLVLASTSPTRVRMLRSCGLAFSQVAPAVDEDAVKTACRDAELNGERTAERLAEAKALAVSTRVAGALVIGADQLLVAGDRWFDKPATVERARETLQALRGCRHRLISGVAVARDGAVLWTHVAVAELEMRCYSDAFIEWYLATAGASVLDVVGACRLEGLGAQLFATIDGDYYTILGLPLLPLLGYLRQLGTIHD